MTQLGAVERRVISPGGTEIPVVKGGREDRIKPVDRHKSCGHNGSSIATSQVPNDHSMKLKGPPDFHQSGANTTRKRLPVQCLHSSEFSPQTRLRTSIWLYNSKNYFLIPFVNIAPLFQTLSSSNKTFLLPISHLSKFKPSPDRSISNAAGRPTSELSRFNTIHEHSDKARLAANDVTELPGNKIGTVQSDNNLARTVFYSKQLI